MKIADIINQLRLVLPKYTDLFSNTLGITSIVASGGTATINTDPVHKLKTGHAVTISDVGTNTPISAVSKDGLVVTFTTSEDHDLTENWPEHDTVALRGFTDGDWNDSFTLLDVPNRRNFSVRSTLAEPVLNGNEYLEEVRSDGVNGRWSVTVVTGTQFTISGTFIDADYTGGTVKTAVRISGAVTPKRAIDQYTQQELENLWMFVVPNDAEASKDRSTFSDAVKTAPAGTSMRLRLLDGFSLILIENASEDITGIGSVDTMRDTLLLPILKSVFGVRFDTGLSGSADFRSILSGHGFVEYNRAYLVYEYTFQVVMDLTEADAVEPSDTRAFRDIDYTQVVGGDDTPDMTIEEIDLDEVPL
jgi:hypothetical protein